LVLGCGCAEGENEKVAGSVAVAAPALGRDFTGSTGAVGSSMLTGTCPREHGIVANGWYDRESAEVRFWKQSNHLVRGEKVWEHLRRKHPGFTCAKLFWWYNMYSSADISITPRPLYPADGRKVFDIHTQPMDLRERIKADLRRTMGIGGAAAAQAAAGAEE